MIIPFATQSYQNRAGQFSSQRLVNMYAEIAPAESGGKNTVVLHNAPGIKNFATGLPGAVRGAFFMGGVLYVVAGDKFLSINSAGTPTVIGSINTPVGNVSMDANRASPQQLCFVDGTDGWIYDTSGGLQEITDADFASADTVTFQDGYFIFNKSGTSEFFTSEIDNGLSIIATDFADAEASPDECLAVNSYHQELWVYGEQTIEVYSNTGNTDFPFERILGAVIERGLGATFSIADDEGAQFWLGDDKIIYVSNGYQPQRVSTHPIEEIIRKMTSVSDAVGYIITVAGHKFYHIVFPTGKRAFVFDIATGLWHERESFGSDYWRGNAYVEAYGKMLIGDAFQGRIGEYDPDTYTEFGEIIKNEATGLIIHNDRKKVRHNRFEIDFQSGVGTTTGAEPFMWLDYSDDGGVTYSSRKPSRSLGKIGKYTTRARWSRLGSSRERVYRLTSSADVMKSFFAAHLNAGGRRS